MVGTGSERVLEGDKEGGGEEGAWKEKKGGKDKKGQIYFFSETTEFIS